MNYLKPKEVLVVLGQLELNNMNKKLLSIGLCLLTVFGLTGCSSTSDKSEEYKDIGQSRFCIIKSYYDGYEMYDKETGEMYFTYHNNSTNYCNGIIDLHKTYEGWDK